MHPKRLPSPATAIALLALFVALGGTGYAVSRIDGSKLKNRSVAAKKLRKDTLTGTEINEDKTNFLQPCHFGTVHGFVRVKAAADFPATFTDQVPERLELPFDCGNGTVYARRVDQGVYVVHFDPPIGAFGFANAEAGAFASVTGAPDSTAPGDDKYSFEVRIRGGEPVAQPSDIPFELMVP